MKKHLFLEKAFVYPLNEKHIGLPDSDYDYLKGFWINKKLNIPSIEDVNFSGPRTKKHDIETGEDQKGE